LNLNLKLNVAWLTVAAAQHDLPTLLPLTNAAAISANLQLFIAATSQQGRQTRWHEASKQFAAQEGAGQNQRPRVLRLAKMLKNSLQNLSERAGLRMQIAQGRVHG
jgi:hypothetical protein